MWSLFFLYFTLSSGIQVQNVQVCYTGIHMPDLFAAPINLSSTLSISPNAIPPVAPTHCYPSPSPPLPNRPQCVMLLSLSPCVLIVQHPSMNKNMQWLVFCSCVSLLRMMVFRFIHVPTQDTNSSFLWLHSIPYVHVPHFPCPVYHRWALGLIPGLCYCKQYHSEHICACVFIIEQF